MLRIVIASVIVFGFCQPTLGETANKTQPTKISAAPGQLISLLDRVEERYRMPGFSASFKQTSTLKAMQITDTASGRAVFKRPAKMRWSYHTPEPQEIITDGTNLWLYRPEDQQVAMGAFPDFFGDGKGAGFLTDIDQLRKKFDIEFDGSQTGEDPVLVLTPKRKSEDITRLELTVSAKTADIYRIVTVNSYGDETVIELSAIQPETDLDDGLFKFNIPDNTDIIQLSR